MNTTTDARIEIAATNCITSAAKFFELAADFVPTEFLEELLSAKEVSISIKLKPAISLHITALSDDESVNRFDMPIKLKGELP